ncbi:MAG: transporter, partial [Methylomonas sp.]
ERIGLAKAEVFKLTASLNAKQVNGPLLAGPGLDVTLPIVNQNQGGIAQAQARFDKAARQYVATRQRIALDVREAHARLQQASESLKQWQQTILPPLRIAIQDAENAYAAGNVTYLFVLETQRRWLDAQLKTAQAAADLRRARAELERSVGQRLKPA